MSLEIDSMRYLKDLLFTETHMIRGHANTGDRRLSTFLNMTRKYFLEMEEATLIRHDGGGALQAGWMLVRLDDILLAHEMEVTGDEGLRLLGKNAGNEIAITAHFNGRLPLQLSGKVRGRSIDSDTVRNHDFFVVVDPVLRGFTANASHEYAIFKNLPYVIANRNRIAFILR